MRSLAFVLALLTAASARADVYLIGNSLTADARCWDLDDVAGYHVQCGTALPQIYANPAPCFVAGGNWDVALAANQYDVLCVQPYFPYTSASVADNVAVISAWMTLQPDAKIVVKTSYPRTNGSNWTADVEAIIAHSEAIVAELTTLHPGREIVRDKAADALLQVATDAANGVGPFSSVFSLYRDIHHLINDGTGQGGFLTHNTLRAAIGQPLKLDMFPTMPAAHRSYLIGARPGHGRAGGVVVPVRRAGPGRVLPAPSFEGPLNG